MDEEPLLLTPGPVPVDPRVRGVGAKPMVSHRSPAFEAVYERVQSGLDYVFEQSTAEEAATSAGGTSLALNGTATMAMEAAVANLVGPDDEVVSVVNGKFGRRFARIAERHAGHVERVAVPWGESVPVDAVADAVTDATVMVTVVHNETSTGLLNPVAEFGTVAADHDAWFVVDGVTSVGGDEFRIDDWEVDVAVTDAQKALAAPPGISALYLTDAAAAAVDGEHAPFYEDLDWHLRKAGTDQTPFTSAVPLFRSMATALELLREEGIGDRIARHRRQAAAVRAGLDALGFDPFPEPTGPTERSNTVTAVELPDPIRGDRAGEFLAAVADHGVEIAGGQAHLGGEIARVSNMGGLSDDEIRRGIEAIGAGLVDIGIDADPEAGVAAANDALE